MKVILAALVPLALAGCTQPVSLPAPGPLTRAAAPEAAHPAPAGPPVVYTSHPLADPEDWRGLNDAQAPGGGA